MSDVSELGFILVGRGHFRHFHDMIPVHCSTRGSIEQDPNVFRARVGAVAEVAILDRGDSRSF